MGQQSMKTAAPCLQSRDAAGTRRYSLTVPHAPTHEKELPLSDRVLWSEAIAAKACSISLVTFRKWARLGLIHKVDLPGGLRRNLYRPSDVQALADHLDKRR